MGDERFSEKEVSLVLRRAAEIDAAGASASAGLTQSDIEAIAGEVGIGTDAVRRAMAEIAGSGDTGRALLAPASRRTSRKIEGTLSRDQLGELVRVIEDRVGRPGTVTEALDTVRWTAQEAGRWTTQVSVSAVDGETRVSVHERVADGIRTVFHLLPSLWGGMIGIGISASANANPLSILAIATGCAALGFGIGRTIFGWRSRRGERRVNELGDRLEETAKALATKGPEDA